MMDCSDLRNLKPGGVYLQGDSGTGVTYPPLKFNPMTGHSFDGVERIQKASDYRGVTWSYNPWTGMRRSLDDVDNDPNGSQIQPPREYMFPTDGARFVTGMSVAVDLAQEGAERTVTVAPPEEERCPPSQDVPLEYHPETGQSFAGMTPLPRAADYRTRIWRYNPWIGTKRHSYDVNRDPYGRHIIPPGKPPEEEEEEEEEELFSNYKPSLEVQVGGNHYKDMKIQPVEFIHANGIGYIEGCVIKYVSRWRKKNGVEDLKKARHFIDLLLELENAK